MPNTANAVEHLRLDSFGRGVEIHLKVMKNVKTIALRAAELLLFFIALAMLVPPVSSEAKTVYQITPTLIIGGGAFALSLIIATCRRAEHWFSAGLKLVFYFVLAWIIHERLFGFR